MAIPSQHLDVVPMARRSSIASDQISQATRVEDEPEQLDGTSSPISSNRSTFKSVILVLTCTFAMIVNSANNTAISISLSTVGRKLHIRQTQLQWLVSAYPLSSGCLLLFFGRLADLYGRKKVFVGGSLTLAIFTLGCGFANRSVTLDILRGFQGIGAAATIPASLGILANAFPPSRARSAAYATFASGAPIGAAFGNVIGGTLTEKTRETWRSPFFFQAGLTILCLLGGLASFDKDTPSSEIDRRIDWLGTFLVTAGLVLIVFVLGQGQIAPQGWRTPYIIGLLITGVLFLSLFLLWQAYLEKVATTDVNSTSSQISASKQDDVLNVNLSWRMPPPLMKLSLWRRANGRFAAMMWIAFLTWCAFWSWVFWAQLYYQRLLRISPLQTVLRLLPMFVSGIICNIIVATVISHVPIVYLLATGTFGSSLACLLFATINPSATYWAFGFPGAIVAVIGADFVFATGTLFISHVAKPNEQSLAGGLFQTMTQLGTSFGVAVTTVIFDSVTQGNPGRRPDGRPLRPGLASYQAAQWGCFAFGILAMILAITFFRSVGVIGEKREVEEVAAAPVADCVIKKGLGGFGRRGTDRGRMEGEKSVESGGRMSCHF